MNAVVLREPGGPEVLRVEAVADPAPAAGDVVVRLRAAAVNHRDIWIRSGISPRPSTAPVVLGSDGSGEIVAVGEGVDRAWLGAAVVINPSLEWGSDPAVQGPGWRILGMPDNGTYAELIRVPAESVYRKPSALSFEEAAAIPLAGLTAYRALFTRAALRSNDTVLVTGIGGGVALFVLAFAARAGARVIVTSSSEAKLARARELGAAAGVSYREANWSKAVVELADGQGPSVVIDGTGGVTLTKAIEAARPGARVVNYGGTAGPINNLSPRLIFWRHINLLGSTMGTGDEFAAMLRLYESGLVPVVDSVRPLSDVAAAHARMERSEQFGKLVLSIT
jgi:NADPH:quinone reductase-like Zn-dependent oxidoreductase